MARRPFDPAGARRRSESDKPKRERRIDRKTRFGVEHPVVVR
jgi:hypothetical protein